jgi:hypothetical protein
MELTTNETNAIADICNPGFGPPLYEPYDEPHVPEFLRLAVLVALRFHPTLYGHKWHLDEAALSAKLEQASSEELAELARAVTQFWTECELGKDMSAYYPTAL